MCIYDTYTYIYTSEVVVYPTNGVCCSEGKGGTGLLFTDAGPVCWDDATQLLHQQQQQQRGAQMHREPRGQTATVGSHIVKQNTTASESQRERERESRMARCKRSSDAGMVVTCPASSIDKRLSVPSVPTTSDIGRRRRRRR